MIIRTPKDIIITPTAGQIYFQADTTSTSGVLESLSGSGITFRSYDPINKPRLTIEGAAGQLFSITDSLSGSLMSVSDISGLPILEVFDDDRVIMGTYGSSAMMVSGTSTTANSIFTNQVTPFAYNELTSKFYVDGITSALTSAGKINFINSLESKEFPTIQSAIDHGATSITSGVVYVGRGVYNESLTLKNNADIFLNEGVTIDGTGVGITIQCSDATVTSSIYGLGTIQNSNNYAVLINPGSLNLQCKQIINYSTSYYGVYFSGGDVSIQCDNVSTSAVGVWINSSNKLDININRIHCGISGLTGSSVPTTTALITNGNGYVNVNEILSFNKGHCLSHRGGDVLAKVGKLWNWNNHASFAIVPLIVGQGTGTQTLKLYFDEINSTTNLATLSLWAGAVDAGSQGTLHLNGRSISGNGDWAVTIRNGSITVDNIYSGYNWGGISYNGLTSNGHNLDIKNTKIKLRNINQTAIMVVGIYGNGSNQVGNISVQNCFFDDGLTGALSGTGVSINNWTTATANLRVLGTCLVTSPIGPNINLLYGTTSNGWFINTNNVPVFDLWKRTPSLSSTYLSNITDNVGIGTLTPSEKLSVSGNISSTGNVYSTNIISAGNYVYAPKLISNQGIYQGFTFNGATTNYYGTIGSNDLTMYIGDIPQVTVKSNSTSISGNVSITGNMSVGGAPMTRRLHVSYGDIKFDDVPAPTTLTASVSAGVTGNLSGTYYYGMTYYTAEGETQFVPAGSGWGIVVPSTGGQVYLSLPISDNSKVVGRKLYRQQNPPLGNPAYFYKVLDIPNNTAVYNFLDNLDNTSITSARTYYNYYAGMYNTTSQRIWGSGIYGAEALMMQLGPNVSIGENAGRNATMNNVSNVYIGNRAGYSSSANKNTVYIGTNAGQLCQADANVAIGPNTLQYLIDGTDNVAIGSGTLQYTLGGFSVALGTGACAVNTAGGNIGLGYVTTQTLSGGYNIGLGNYALGGYAISILGVYPPNINSNIAMGYMTLATLTAGDNNTVIGVESGWFLQGAGNSVLGANALQMGPSGWFTQNRSNYTTALGYGAGNYTAGDYNIFLGYNAGYNRGTVSNRLHVGVYPNTSLIYGEFDNHKLGINTESVSAVLTVSGNALFTSTVSSNGYSTNSISGITNNTADNYLSQISSSGGLIVGLTSVAISSITASLTGATLWNRVGTNTLLSNSADLVGIATSSPQSPLQIGNGLNRYGGGYAGLQITHPQYHGAIIEADGANWAFLGGNTTYGNEILFGGADVIDFRTIVSTVGTGLVLKQSTGNVGIWTNAPSQRLSVNGNISVSGSHYYSVTSITLNYTITTNDFIVVALSSSLVATLPTAINNKGLQYHCKNISPGNFTVSANDSELIDNTNTTIVPQWANLYIVSTGSQWIIL